MRAGDRVGLLTSGGDAPGMNAALRAAARVGAALGLEIVGVEDGYRGLLERRLRPLTLRELDDAARRGGTVLGTARSMRFATAEGQELARDTLIKERVRALMVIGGNGSLAGARALERAGIIVDGQPLRIAGVPASIDNDLACTSMAIGVDTAMNTIVEACDRICDTAASHRRTFILEVMGRDCGYLAMTSAVAAGADVVLVREVGKDDAALVEQVARAMEAAYARDQGKRRVLVVKSEGIKLDSTRLKEAVDARIKASLPDVDTRVTVLGHVVRGGSPTAFDRLLGARLANAAMRALADGQSGFMSGWVGPGVKRPACDYDPYVVLTPIDEVLTETARLMDGESDLARWRKRVFEEIEPILTR
ncbi:MAG TPA: 6-phosphofructokinase [Polyangia bacterium]|nr:6-phosphofructokinase [Polyangia bacterium]